MATVVKMSGVKRCVSSLPVTLREIIPARTNMTTIRRTLWNITSTQYKTRESEGTILRQFPCRISTGAYRLSLRHICNQKTYARHCHSVTPSSKCWKCDAYTDTNDSFCPECGLVQKLNDTWNHFQVMGVPVQSTIDAPLLKKKFRLLQGLFHPDRFTTKSEEEQKIAAERSSCVNKAYAVLQHPVQRVEYCLMLHGQPLEEGKIDMDPSFLMEIMEVNEELDDAEDAEAVREIGIRNQKLLNGFLKEVDTAFAAGDINTAKKIVAKVKYYNNIYEKIREYERKHGILD